MSLSGALGDVMFSFLRRRKPDKPPQQPAVLSGVRHFVNSVLPQPKPKPVKNNRFVFAVAYISGLLTGALLVMFLSQIWGLFL